MNIFLHNVNFKKKENKKSILISQNILRVNESKAHTT